ncbi:MAG: choice-of-anchor L domain-containing protein [Bacteroidales bacterium]
MRLSKVIFLILTFFGALECVVGQESSDSFTVIPCKTDQDVVNVVDTVLLRGLKEKGLVSNIRFLRGDPSMVGRFYGGSKISFDRGIVFSTGLASTVVGPNKKGSTSKNMGLQGDDDLQKLAGGSLKSKDAVVVEFDFTPISDHVEFEYFFGSEEYNNFVGSSYNDVFGFFISGEGISGTYNNKSKNIALIPGTTDYVGINSVNCGKESNYKTPPPGKGPNCSSLIWNNNFSGVAGAENYPEYNAYTVPLKAESEVVSCKVYRMKLAISDIQDNSYDSGVFFKAGSFKLGGVTVQKTASNKTLGNVLIKGCNTVKIEFNTNSVRKKDVSFPVIYGGDVRLGVDVPHLPTEVKIPKGEKTVSIDLTSINANIREEKKKLIVVYPQNICVMSDLKYDTVYFKPLNKVLGNELPDKNIYSCMQEVSFKANPHKGIAPYTVTWDKMGEMQNGDEIKFNASKPGLIKLNITDACGSTFEDEVKVELEPVKMDVGPDLEICQGQSIQLEAKTNASSVVWSDGSTDKKIFVKVDKAKSVWCEGINACGMSGKDIIVLNAILPIADAGKDTLICPNQKVKLFANKGTSWKWNTGEDTQTIEVSPKKEQKYIVEVTDKCGNVASDEVIVSVKNDEIAFAGNDTIVCRGSVLLFKAVGGKKVEWLMDKSILTKDRNFNLKADQDFDLILKAYDYCTTLDTVKVKIQKFPKFNFDYAPAKGCKPVTFKLKNKTNDLDTLNWVWTYGDDEIGKKKDFSYSFDSSGKYSLFAKVKSKKGCVDSLRIVDVVEVYKDPETVILPRKEAYVTGDRLYKFYAEENNPDWTYTWETMEGKQFVGASVDLNFKEEKEWILKLFTEDNHGCKSETKVKFLAFDNNTLIKVPNAFSPNGDGLNDYFQILHRSVTDFKCLIYNRWGEKVYETKDPDFKWNGGLNDNQNEFATSFAVYIEYKDLEGAIRSYKGLIHAVK